MTDNSSERPAGGARYLIGVDVGTGSARAGVFDRQRPHAGVGQARHRALSRGRSHRRAVEQRDLARGLRSRARGGRDRPASTRSRSAGIGFDATCSLVVLGEGGAPLPVGPSEDPERNIIVWMDHRAVDAGRAHQRHGPRRCCAMSAAASRPRWRRRSCSGCKENRPQIFDAAWQFFDLADFLTWRATGDLARSTCTVTCKWTYLAHERRWDESYFRQIGLGELADEAFARIGSDVVEPGTPLGDGLTRRRRRRARPAGRHAGRRRHDRRPCGRHRHGRRRRADRKACLGYVFGTSACTMTSTRRAGLRAGRLGAVLLGDGARDVAQRRRPIRRRRGDRAAAVVPPGGGEAAELARSRGMSLPVLLAELARGRAERYRASVRLADGLHVVPEFLGNRAPVRRSACARRHRRARHGARHRQPRLALHRRALRHRLRAAPDHRRPGRRPERRSTRS